MITYIVGEKNLFSSEHIESMKKYGEIIFLNSDNYIEEIITNNNEKIIVYDPDFGGWSFPNDILETASNLKAVFLGTTDKSYIDLEYCENNGISVYNIPRYAADSVAEYLVMYMFACAKKIPLQIKNNNKQDFTDEFLQMQLKDKKVGIVGLGNIGTKIADICDGIGMKVYYWNRKIKQSNYEYISLKKLFKLCDVIYLCLQINDDTSKIITDDLLLSLKENSIFISCTGKKLFNYSIIEKKISAGKLFGYAIEEPDISLSTYKGNVMVTSEYGWFTKDAAILRVEKWYQNIIKYLCDINNISLDGFMNNTLKKRKTSLLVNIRKAIKDDIPAIVRLYKSENWLGDDNSVDKIVENYDYNSKHNYLLVAEYKGKVIGTITFSVNKAYAFNCMKYIVFDYLVIDKKFRRRRVGTQLIGSLVSMAKKKKLESIWGVSSIGRSKAHKFYDYVGFSDPVKGFRRVFIAE